VLVLNSLNAAILFESEFLLQKRFFDDEEGIGCSDWIMQRIRNDETVCKNLNEFLSRLIPRNFT
jgi:hypothetical protein